MPEDATVPKPAKRNLFMKNFAKNRHATVVHTVKPLIKTGQAHLLFLRDSRKLAVRRVGFLIVNARSFRTKLFLGNQVALLDGAAIEREQIFRKWTKQQIPARRSFAKAAQE